MKNLKLAAAVAAIALSSMAFGASAPYSYARVYRAGSQFDYTLATRVDRNGKPASTSVAVAHDLVVSKAGAPSDQMTFTHLKECAVAGTSACKVLDARARQVPPFFLSLAAGGSTRRSGCPWRRRPQAGTRTLPRQSRLLQVLSSAGAVEPFATDQSVGAREEFRKR